ncbi:helix-turn-helix domain-containing protein [Mycobacteroides abscessus]|uniref:helix-turn-helix domain-containing protein n=1 Tax=Mycobacteroides abscessus TaxID=36809 RepID=UPI0005E972E6|nr:helix-turn-helix domain-containing protein [Mycobacteroides abscessus]CPR69457.1 DNA binding domain%2C excisionase family [Mycobacteroides abscessus]CPU70643.1 DNA binding domain%2C excisionase family [Mycobacteroides abscessus]
MDTDDRLYKFVEAAEALRIGRTHFYRLMAEGRIRPLRLGSRTLIPRSEVRRLIREATGG